MPSDPERSEVTTWPGQPLSTTDLQRLYPTTDHPAPFRPHKPWPTLSPSQRSAARLSQAFQQTLSHMQHQLDTIFLQGYPAPRPSPNLQAITLQLKASSATQHATTASTQPSTTPKVRR